MFLCFFYIALSFDNFYCEPFLPKYNIVGNNSDLVQVHIITRHGARTPLHISKKFNNQWVCKNTELISFEPSFKNSLHVSVQFGRSIFKGNCLIGQLVDKGVTALIKLGKYIRRIYVDEMKFLPNNYVEYYLKFRTTRSHRTIHSQMSFIKGLYPDASNVVLNIADENNDPWKRAKLLCPKFNKIYKHIKLTDEIYRTKFKDDTFTSKLSKLLGVNWGFVNDAITSSKCEGLPIINNLSDRAIDEAIRLKAMQMQYIYSHNSLYNLLVSYSLAEMINEIIDRINGMTSIKLVHWSAHDNNLLGILGYLGYKHEIWPPYGSFITVELYKDRNTKNFFLIFKFNGRTITIPRFNNRTVIPFDEFRKFVDKHLPSPKDECRLDINSYLKKDASVCCLLS